MLQRKAAVEQESNLDLIINGQILLRAVKNIYR